MDLDEDELLARAALAAAHQQIRDLTAILAEQARTIARLSEKYEPSDRPTITVREIYRRFEDARKSSPSWRVTRNRLRAFLIAFGETPATSLTVPMWAAFRERRKIDDEQLGAAVAPVTINFELDWAKRLLNWACGEEQALIPSNPIDKAKRESVDCSRETWLTEEDLQTLLKGCNELLRAFVLVAIDTGLRLSEVLRIRRDRIRLYENQAGEHLGTVEFSKRETKGKRGHLIGITARAVAAIEAFPDTVNPYVFASPYVAGKPYSPRQIERLFRAACEETGIDVRAADGDVRIRVHDLRHSAASAATRRGASLLQVQRMLNHSSPAITARYVHHDEGGAIALAELMEAGALAERTRLPPRRVEPVVMGEGKKIRVVRLGD